MTVAVGETATPSGSNEVPAVPDPGQVVEVRGSTWAVARVQQQGLPRSPAPVEGTPGMARVGPAQTGTLHEAVTGLREVLAGLRRVDHSLGSGAALATVLAQIPVAEHLLANAASGRATQEVFAGLGEIHQLAGWMHFDRGELTAAEASLTAPGVSLNRRTARLWWRTSSGRVMHS